jgi:hypothetical protein
MEIRSGFRSIIKPVILQIPTVIFATLAVTDTLFLTNLQKRAKHTEMKLPFFNNKSSKKIVTVR